MMSKARAKTIKLLLKDGSLNGVISIADSLWNSGKLYSSPRESVEDLLKEEACNNYGVYLLLSDDMVYVGQSSDLSKRIKQHIIGKDWWDRVVLLTTDNDSLDKSDIDYLEATLIEQAEKVGRLDSDNKNRGNKKKVNEFRKVELEQYLEEALFLLELIGITVFSENRKQKNNLSKSFGIDTTAFEKTSQEKAFRRKAEVISYLKDMGAALNSKINYATINEQSVYWLNPRTECLEKYWTVVLHDPVQKKISVLNIPPATFTIGTEVNSRSLFTRSDRPELIDMHIESDTLIEKRSSVNLSKFLDKVYEY